MKFGRSRWVVCSSGLCLLLGLSACEDQGASIQAPVMSPPAMPTAASGGLDTGTPVNPPQDALPAVPNTPSMPLDPALPPDSEPPPMNAPDPMLPADLETAPARLSETGLFADIALGTLGPSVEAYEPNYKLWTDGADKRRWLALPPGTTIDTSDMDAWRFPIGTRIWKEFAKDGQVLETRYMAKYGPDGMDWVFMAYQWDPALGDGVAVPDGVKNTAGTQHDIPSDLTCLKCHEGLPDGALGVSAIQLAHDGPGLTLDSLVTAGRVTHAPSTDLQLPGDEVERAALGYLHANCGHCHNPNGGEATRKNPRVLFWQEADRLASVEDTPTYANLIAGTDFNLSFLVKSLERMRSRPDGQMPPVGTELVDAQGVEAVGAWVDRLLVAYPQDGLPDLSTPPMP